MKQIRHFACLSLLLFVLTHTISVDAQEKQVLTFQTYMNNVKNCNISYLAEQYNVEIATANLRAARVFPDPELSVTYGNNENWILQMGYNVEADLTYTLELGGKRKARIGIAQSEKEMTDALLEDYFRTLRSDATIAYLNALKHKKLYEIQQSSYQQMLQLAHADSIRFRLGTITEIDARQSKLEAATMLNDVYANEGSLQEALVQLILFQGSKTTELPDSIASELTYLKRDFDLPSLIITAQNNRADLQAALKSREVSRQNLRLARANRFIDLGLTLGGSYSGIVRNETAPAPAFKSISAGISIPLKLSNTNKGQLRAAQLAVRQSEAQYEAVELQIYTEVVQAYHKYLNACRQVEHFNTGHLREAEAIYLKKVDSYQRGETTILDLLNARRTYNDLQVTYNDTLYTCATALVNLEHVSAVWHFGANVTE